MIKRISAIVVVALVLLIYVVYASWMSDYDSFEYMDAAGSTSGSIEIRGYWDDSLDSFIIEEISASILVSSVANSPNWHVYYYSENSDTCDFTSRMWICQSSCIDCNCSPFYGLVQYGEFEIRDLIYGTLHVDIGTVDGRISWDLYVRLPENGYMSCSGPGCPIIYIGNGSYYVSIGKATFSNIDVTTLTFTIDNVATLPIDFNSGYLDILILEYIPYLHIEKVLVNSIQIFSGDSKVKPVTIRTGNIFDLDKTSDLNYWMERLDMVLDKGDYILLRLSLRDIISNGGGISIMITGINWIKV